MNTTRRRSILILTATLIFGILLGLLIPAAINKVGSRAQKGSSQSAGDGFHRRHRFESTLHQLLKPDSVQARQIKPVMQWAAARIDSIELSANTQVEAVFDSISIRLTPVLQEDQRQRLEEFHHRVSNHWKRRGRHR
jgi:hypothetical protein